MKARDKQDVLQMAKEWDVKFIRLQFTDIFGVLKNVAITVERLEEALNGEVLFDGSSIDGMVRLEESDMRLLPDPSTFALFPWRPAEGSVARLICDVYTADGAPFSGCPRLTLKRNIEDLSKHGYRANVGLEAEFFLFHTDEQGRPTLSTHDRGGYFDLSPVDLGENARRDIILVLDGMGIRVEASHHEFAPGQHEIVFGHDEALRTADNMVTLRYVVRTIAQRHGLHATFMPKPISKVHGSGMHMSQSLFIGERNIFWDPEAPSGLSEVALYYIGGLIEHCRAMTAITNPTVNSYKRLVPGYEAPTYIAWSFRNRSPLIRIPNQRDRMTRVELRNPDPSSNPYLAIAVALASGIDGVLRKVVPPKSVEKNIYEMSDEERERLGIRSLPRDLAEALDELSRDQIVKAALGDHIYTKFVEAKRIEWEEYRSCVHGWEINQYLDKF